jgi:hypothetical protein
MGAVESNVALAGALGNPVGAAVVAGGKVLLAEKARDLGARDCRGVSGMLFGLGWGAAASNLLVIAGAATGGFGLAIPLGIAAMGGYKAAGLGDHDCREMTRDDLYADATQTMYTKMMRESARKGTGFGW